MATTGTSSPAAIIAKIDALEAGTTKNIVGKATITVKGTAMTAAQILAQFGTLDTAYAAVTAARSTLKQALAAYEALVPGMQLFIKNYESAIKTEFGVDSPILGDFGLKPVGKAAPRTAAEKAVSSALARQTRAVRGPTSKKARAAITTQGKPGLVLVSSTGTPIPGGIAGPIPPGSGTPVDAAAALVSTSSTPSTEVAAPGTGSTPTGK